MLDFRTTTEQMLGPGHARQVRPVPMEQLPAAIRRKLGRLRPHMAARACFRNAWLVAKRTGCHYVEGELHIGVPIEHAWNAVEVDGTLVHFDLTGELFHEPPLERPYAAVVSGTPAEIEASYDMDSVVTVLTQFINRCLRKQEAGADNAMSRGIGQAP